MSDLGPGRGGPLVSWGVQARGGPGNAPAGQPGASFSRARPPKRGNRWGRAMGRPLNLRQEPSGPRHYLDGRAVHAGDTLELAVFEGVTVCAQGDPDPVWLRGRYEWSYQAGDAPRFYLELGDGKALGAGACVGLAEFKLPEAAVLRWPSE